MPVRANSEPKGARCDGQRDHACSQQHGSWMADRELPKSSQRCPPRGKMGNYRMLTQLRDAMTPLGGTQYGLTSRKRDYRRSGGTGGVRKRGGQAYQSPLRPAIIDAV